MDLHHLLTTTAPVATSSTPPGPVLAPPTVQVQRVAPPAASTSKPAARSRPATSTASTAAAGDQATCPICAKLAYKKGREVGVVWLGCEMCETWYHWSCVTANPLDSVDIVDKWFCPPCTFSSPKNVTTYKIPPRKSQRSTRQQIDYANLNAHIPSDPDRWQRVLASRTVIEGAFPEMTGKEMNEAWLWGDESLREPVVIQDEEGLGMTMPSRDITVGQVSEAVGPTTPIEVIDVSSQSSLSHWTLSQWASYYVDPARDKVRNVISLEVSESSLAAQIIPPWIVRQLDWVATIWPPELKQDKIYPQVQKYCLMSVAKCWTDWHVDFAGSSVFYHILRGSKVFYFIRPTDANLAAYETWSGDAERQESTWLGDQVDTVYKVTLTAGNTMIIPTGWIHAVYTPSDSLVFGGNFLHSLEISTQLRIYQIELNTKVPRKFRFPFFVRLLWHVAKAYTSRLEASHGKPLAIDLSKRVLRGLKDLTVFLLDQTGRFAKGTEASAERKKIARENVPWDYVPEPLPLVKRFRKEVVRALGEPEEVGWGIIIEVPKVKVATPSHKRKVDVLEGANEQANGKSKSKNASKSASPLAALKVKTAKAPVSRNEGTIISRLVTPVVSSLNITPRFDPSSPKVAPVRAEVRTTESTTEVVRRIVEEDGVVVLETRRVVTMIERVRWTKEAMVEVKEEVKPAMGLNLLDAIGAFLPPSLPSLPPLPPLSLSQNPHPLPLTVRPNQAMNVVPLDK